MQQVQTTEFKKMLNKKITTKKNAAIVRLPKNIGAIQISNDLTSVERKIMNIVLHNATLIEKDNMVSSNKIMLQDNRKFYKILITDIEHELGWKSHSNRDEIKKILDNLVRTSLKFNILSKQNTDNGRWNITTTILAAVITKDDSNDVYYAFSDPLKDIILKPTIYGMLNLETQKSIDSRYTLALWEYLSGEIALSQIKNNKQKEYITEYIAIENYKELIAGNESNYQIFGDINRFLVKNPLHELNEKTDIHAAVEYKKTGRKMSDLRFKIVQNQVDIIEIDQSEQRELFDKDEVVYKYNSINKLLIQYKISETKRKAVVVKYKPEYIEANIKFVVNTKEYSTITNKAPLIIKAIDENYANFGPEKDKLDAINQMLMTLRQMVNPYDKNDRQFLKNRIRDYKIYLERNDIENLNLSIERLKKSIVEFNRIRQTLIKSGLTQIEILKEIGLESEQDIWQKIGIAKDHLNQLESTLLH